MNIDIQPSLTIDFCLLGTADRFDRHSKPGFVVVYFDNGSEVKLPMDIFEHARFQLKDKVARVSTGAGAFTLQPQHNAAATSNFLIAKPGLGPEMHQKMLKMGGSSLT